MHRVIRAHSDFRQTELRNQLTSLVLYESVTTTAAKARNLVPFSNHFFNRIKTADLTAKRLAHATLFDKKAVAKVFEEVLPRYQTEATTFVRSLKVTPRRGDSAPQMLVALLKPLNTEAKPPKPATKPRGKKKAA